MSISSIWAAIDYLDLAANSLTVALVEDELLLRTTLREHLPAPSKCSIVALSRSCTATERNRLRQLGVVEILAKPYECEALQALVRRLG